MRRTACRDLDRGGEEEGGEARMRRRAYLDLDRDGAARRGGRLRDWGGAALRWFSFSFCYTEEGTVVVETQTRTRTQLKSCLRSFCGYGSVRERGFLSR